MFFNLFCKILHSSFFILKYCTNLTSITISDSVTSIGEYAFQNCSSLDSVTFQAGSQCEIGESAFRYCSSLVSVEIPSSVTSIGNDAFFGCSKLSTVKVEAVIPPTLGVYVFDSTDAGLKIQVPSDLVEKYKDAGNWSAYEDKIEAITS